MGSLFDSDFFSDAAWSVLVSQLGETSTVTITPSGQAATTVTAIFQQGRVLGANEASDPREPETFGVLLIRANAVSGWTPAMGDAVAIGSADYFVESYGKLDGPIWEIQITDGE